MANKKNVQKDIKYYAKGVGGVVIATIIDFTAKELKSYVKEKFFDK